MKCHLSRLVCEYDDLELSLIQQQNSWRETGNIMEIDLDKQKNQTIKALNEMKKYKYKYERLQPEYDRLQMENEQLQKEIFQLSSDHEIQISQLKFEANKKLVTSSNLVNKLMLSSTQNNDLRDVLQQLLHTNERELLSSTNAVMPGTPIPDWNLNNNYANIINHLQRNKNTASALVDNNRMDLENEILNTLTEHPIQDIIRYRSVSSERMLGSDVDDAYDEHHANIHLKQSRKSNHNSGELPAYDDEQEQELHHPFFVDYEIKDVEKQRHLSISTSTDVSCLIIDVDDDDDNKSGEALLENNPRSMETLKISVNDENAKTVRKRKRNKKTFLLKHSKSWSMETTEDSKNVKGKKHKRTLTVSANTFEHKHKKSEILVTPKCVRSKSGSNVKKRKKKKKKIMGDFLTISDGNIDQKEDQKLFNDKRHVKSRSSQNLEEFVEDDENIDDLFLSGPP